MLGQPEGGLWQNQTGWDLDPDLSVATRGSRGTQWAAGQATDTVSEALHIGPAAARLNVTRDMLRNWDRNGLLHVPRHPKNGYRLYGAAELGRARVIRMLRQAGYSVMAILRMLLVFDAGHAGDLGTVLDRPRPDEDVCNVADRWLSTLAVEEQRALDIIQHLAAAIVEA